MLTDKSKGWFEAPAGETWTCPECEESSPIEEWNETEIPCDACGDHPARYCPRCFDAFDNVSGAKRIAKATKASAQ